MPIRPQDYDIKPHIYETKETKKSQVSSEPSSLKGCALRKFFFFFFSVLIFNSSLDVLDATLPQ